MKALYLFLIGFVCHSTLSAKVTVEGDLQQWHRVMLRIEGPNSSETAEINPFTDYRLTATFTHESGSPVVVVPGYFAADGKASESSADSGNVWRANLSPNQTGTWRYELSMVQGSDAAIQLEGGTPVAGVHGATGNFIVSPSDKEAPDFRGRGTLEYVGERYLRFAGDGSRFLKGGVDSPETLLGYADIDGTYLDTSEGNRPPAPHGPIKLPALDKGLHHFRPHLKDWKAGDPTWKNGKGKGLIGGLNYLASHGVNSVYFLTMNVNGDGRNVWPWIDPWKRDRFDCSKLDQWEIVFQHMTKNGMMLHVVTQETENDHLLDRGNLGRERKLYYRELVARFAHHPAITWNLGEENVQSSAQQRACAAEIDRLDPYKHHIVIHNDHWHAKNLRETFDPLLDSKLTGTALQDFYWPDVHTHVSHYVKASAETGRPWVVTADELGGANFGTLTDEKDPSKDTPRRFGLWATLMAGGAGVEWYFGWQNNSPHSDLSAEDWRTRETIYKQTRLALEFFHKHLPFHQMEPANERVLGNGIMALGQANKLLAIYLPNGGGTRFQLGDEPGLYEVKWFDPRNGGELMDGEITQARAPGMGWTGVPPNEVEKDWLALVRRVKETAPAMQFPGKEWKEQAPMELGVQPNGMRHALNWWKMHSGENGVDQTMIVRRGVVIHRGENATRVHNIWSASKSFTSTALGLLVSDGVVSLDTKAATIEPALAEYYPNALLRHFTSMTSGYSAVGSTRWPNDVSEDWSHTPYAPDKPLFAPGTEYAYWDEAQMMLGRLLTKAANRDMFGYLKERVFDPIGMDVKEWVPEGKHGEIPIRNGCTNLKMNAVELARFGHLFLNEGRWNGKQIVPAEWVRQATTTQVSADTPVADTDRKNTKGSGVYGFNWWVNGLKPDGTRLMPHAPPRTYFAAGLNHNVCVVVPEWDMVIVRMGTDKNPPEGHAGVLDTFFRRFGMAVSPLDEPNNESARVFPPDQGAWMKAHPESLGWNRKELVAARDRMRTDDGKPFTEVDAIVIHEGLEIARYGDPYSVPSGLDAQREWASCGRSIMTTMFGMVFREYDVGVEALEESAHTHFDTYESRTLNKDILIKHLLGYAAFSDPPGTVWQYHSTYFQLYRILRDLDGVPPRYRLITLAKAIGADWEPFEYWGHGQEVPLITFKANAAHAARWGYLWLNEGRWKERQLVDPAFVRASVRPLRKPDDSGWVHHSEGLQIHLNHGGMWGANIPRDAYAAFGAGGRIIFACPSLDLVIAAATTPPPYQKVEKDGLIMRDIRHLIEPIIAAHSS